MDVDSPVSADSVSNPLTKRVDSIYMLSLLIAGSHRMAAQEKLSGLKLAPKLNDLFDQLVWRKQDQGHAAGHISRCNCSPVRFFPHLFSFTSASISTLTFSLLLLYLFYTSDSKI